MGRGEFADAHGPHPDGEEGVVLRGVGVKPADDGEVRLLKLPGHPDGRLSFQSCQMTHYLAQVVVIRVVQLVFDYDAAAVGRKGGQNVGSGTVDRDLAAVRLDGDAYDSRQSLQVVGQPWGEIVGLTGPGFP